MENGSKVDGAECIGEDAKVEPPEVFLGGSCNPTTWRADVAIPALQKLGISFYNPVSI
jgi:sodium-dependent dicarboxylate transporter 2/3/5